MIWFILLISLILRLVALNQSLWLDEAINVNSAAGLDFKSLILNYSLGDFHPPLYHVILRSWILLFGNSEIAARLPSVIFGVGTVFATYLVAKRLFDKKTALIAATLLATAPLHIYYSQEARMYMLAAFLATLSVYFFISILKKDNFIRRKTLFIRRKTSFIAWLGFIISTTLMLYTDYLPYLLVITFIIYLIVNKKRIAKESLKAFIPALILIFILLVPWFLILPKQFSTGLSAAAASPAWAQVVGTPHPKDLLLTFVKFTIGRISHDNNLIYTLLFAPVAAFISFLFLLSLFRISATRSFLWYWLVIPILLGFIIAYFVPIFAYFRFIFLLPAFYLIISSAISTVNWPPLVRFLLVLTLTINLVASTIYFINPKFHREHWREATQYIHNKSTDATLVLFESDYSVGPFDYYNQGKVRAEGALDSFTANESKVAEKVKRLTSDINTVFLFQYLSGITDPQGLVFKELTKQGFTNTKTRDFSGVGFVYEFIR